MTTAACVEQSIPATWTEESGRVLVNEHTWEFKNIKEELQYEGFHLEYLERVQDVHRYALFRLRAQHESKLYGAVIKNKFVHVPKRCFDEALENYLDERRVDFDVYFYNGTTHNSGYYFLCLAIVYDEEQDDSDDDYEPEKSSDFYIQYIAKVFRI